VKQSTLTASFFQDTTATFPPAYKEVSSKTWKLCVPSRKSAEVYEVSSASPKPLDVHTFLCELSILTSWQPIYLNCLKTKLSLPFPCFALANAHNDYIPMQFFNLSVKHEIYYILIGHNNISILDYKYRLLPSCAVDGNKTTTCYWAFTNHLAYFPCKNQINVHQDPLLHKGKKLIPVILHIGCAIAVQDKMTAIKLVLKTEGSQRGCTLWGKVKNGLYHFSLCYLVTAAAISGNKQKNC